jgi:putative ABC transport system permease protein
MAVIRWDDALAETPAEELLRSLADHDGDRVPALLAGPLPDGVDVGVGTEMTLDFHSYYSLPLEVVGRAAAFPGQTGRGPMMVVRWADVTAALEAADRDPRNVFEQQVWASGGERPLLAALADNGYAFNIDGVRTADDFAAQPEVRAQDVSLDYLRAVAVGAGLLGLLGVALHALAQQRRRTVAALLLARMGLSRGAADRSAALETGLLAVLGTVVAVAVALPTSALVVRLLDPAPALLPGPIFTVPRGSILGVLAGAAVVTVVVGLLVARAARRSSAGEVLRDAG